MLTSILILNKIHFSVSGEKNEKGEEEQSSPSSQLNVSGEKNEKGEEEYIS